MSEIRLVIRSSLVPRWEAVTPEVVLTEADERAVEELAQEFDPAKDPFLLGAPTSRRRR